MALTELAVRSLPPDSTASGLDCVVYIVRERGVAHVKVGIAQHPVRRLMALQVGNPRRLEFVAVFHGCRAECRRAEASILSHWDHKRLTGEWLAGDGLDIADHLRESWVVRKGDAA